MKPVEIQTSVSKDQLLKGLEKFTENIDPKEWSYSEGELLVRKGQQICQAILEAPGGRKLQEHLNSHSQERNHHISLSTEEITHLLSKQPTSPEETLLQSRLQQLLSHG